MAVSVAGKTITMTSEGDSWTDALYIKSISWTKATTAGHLLEISQSESAPSPGVIYNDAAAGANYVSRTLVENMYPFGIEITDMDSGEVQITYSTSPR